MNRGNHMDPRRPAHLRQSQHNTASGGGTVYAHQGSGDQIIYAPYTQAPARRGGDSKVLLGVVALDIAFFFYGMLAYTGRNTAADDWRVGIFLFLLMVTGTLIRRWLRRRV